MIRPQRVNSEKYDFYPSTGSATFQCGNSGSQIVDDSYHRYRHKDYWQTDVSSPADVWCVDSSKQQSENDQQSGKDQKETQKGDKSQNWGPPKRQITLRPEQGDPNDDQ
jgi:hypothetical protein